MLKYHFILDTVPCPCNSLGTTCVRCGELWLPKLRILVFVYTTWWEVVLHYRNNDYMRTLDEVDRINVLVLMSPRNRPKPCKHIHVQAVVLHYSLIKYHLLCVLAIRRGPHLNHVVNIAPPNLVSWIFHVGQVLSAELATPYTVTFTCSYSVMLDPIPPNNHL